MSAPGHGAAEGRRTCAVIRAESTYAGKQGFDYFHGVSAESVGSVGICMHLLTIPPGGRAKAHLHENHETAIYVLSGQATMWYGEQLEHVLHCGAGDMVYIPAGMPHLPANLSDTEPCTAVLARTDPNEQESVVLRPDLEGRVSFGAEKSVAMRSESD
ncbi:MAG TPA: cupin domain-containing protein [Thermomicrobiales bacterium]